MDYDLNAFAALMDEGSFEADPTSSDRARVSTSLQQCFDFAATMTPEARRDIYILIDDGAVITAPEIEEFLAGRGLVGEQ
ncbi:MAG TPA: hypothetical protein VEX35_00815 [Allosphingosinicella sp.]|nr:hypothetical protein [Allosphingosinicella sp.]